MTESIEKYLLGFFIGGMASILDMQSVKDKTVLGMTTVGGMNLSVQETAAIGGFLFGLVGSKFYSVDLLVRKMSFSVSNNLFVAFES